MALLVVVAAVEGNPGVRIPVVVALEGMYLGISLVEMPVVAASCI